ncbi:hypothetical protein ColLi_05370 [Colletotrichum liriopes]|uniref:C2H2-type domain-containing protein n=1 Tax=Colletotrichum liriopes TaxID=708192 RepID=A0AA37GLB2_9PEZI|nr:hypothetical protein ColLi_05370 [Colletotrichum liriopes]
MEALSVSNQQDESTSSSSPFDVQEYEETMPVAESSRAAKHKHKHRSSTAKIRSKHTRKDHLPPSIPCDARDASAIRGAPPCEWMFYTNKDMHRHVRNAHPDFAADPNSGIPPEGAYCPECREWIGRVDNLKRHIDEQHKDKQRKRS